MVVVVLVCLVKDQTALLADMVDLAVQIAVIVQMQMAGHMAAVVALPLQ
jgi:hypothetical protein